MCYDRERHLTNISLLKGNDEHESMRQQSDETYELVYHKLNNYRFITFI